MIKTFMLYVQYFNGWKLEGFFNSFDDAADHVKELRASNPCRVYDWKVVKAFEVTS